MKKLAEYINNQYISLKGLDKEVIEKLSNLEGYEINECCCNSCCDDGCPCGCEAPDLTCSDPDIQAQALALSATPPGSIGIRPEIKYPPIFKSAPKVQDAIELHSECSYKCRFQNETIRAKGEPVILIDTSATLDCGKYFMSELLHNDILSISKEFGFNYPIALFRSDGTIQLFFVKFSGTNGKEGSIKNSLIDVADILTKLEKRNEVEWAQVLDVSIDNIDDLYDFLLTCTLNKEKYDKDLEKQAEKDKFPHPINNLGKKL